VAEVFRGNGYNAVLTDHFQERVLQNRGKFKNGFKIPYDKIYRAARRSPNRKCRALLNDQYWIHFIYEPEQNAVVFLSLLPKWYILPEPSNWVSLI
jgi:hypothetical protein